MSVQRRTASSSSRPHDRDERSSVAVEGTDPNGYGGSVGGEDPDDVVDEWEQALRGDDEPVLREQPQYRAEPEQPQYRAEPEQPQYRAEPSQPRQPLPDPDVEQPTQVIDAVPNDELTDSLRERSYRDRSLEAGSIYSGTNYLRSNFASSSDTGSASGYQASGYRRAESDPPETSQLPPGGSDLANRAFGGSDFGGLDRGRSGDSDFTASNDSGSDYGGSDGGSDYGGSELHAAEYEAGSDYRADYGDSHYTDSDESDADETDAEFRARFYRRSSLAQPDAEDRLDQHPVAASGHPAPQPAPRLKSAAEWADELSAARLTNPDRTAAAAERVDLRPSLSTPSTERTDAELSEAAVGQAESKPATALSARLFGTDSAPEQGDTAVTPRVTEDGLAGVDQPADTVDRPAQSAAAAQQAPNDERETGSRWESGNGQQSDTERSGGQQRVERQREPDLGDTAAWTLDQDWDDEEDSDSGDASLDGDAGSQWDGEAGQHGPDDRARDGASQEARTELIPRLFSDQVEPEETAAIPPPPVTRAVAKPRRPLALVLVLVLVTLAATAAAYYCWTKTQELTRARAVSNLAFVDQAATADVRDQVSKAVEAIYSYDATRLDESESRALSFITGSYADEFKRNFAMVRQLGPQQKAALTSTVSEAGVEMLTERRATLLLMVNQVGHRADTPHPLKAFVRLNVTAERIGGQWKVSGISQR